MRTQAFLNWGRWIAACPSTACVGFVDVAGLAIVCTCQEAVVCDHGDVCGTFAWVDWPSDREAVDRICSMRPKANRHWYPGETADDLMRENAEHGI